MVDKRPKGFIALDIKFTKVSVYLKGIYPCFQICLNTLYISSKKPRMKNIDIMQWFNITENF